MEALYKNDNYQVVVDDSSNKNYAVVNKISGVKEYLTDVLPDAVGVAMGFDYTLNKLLSGDVVLDAEDLIQAVQDAVKSQDDDDDDEPTMN